MKKFLTAVVLASGIGLGGCSTIGGLPANITAILAQISAVTTQVCGYVVNPTAAEISSIVALLDGGVNIENIAVSICSAVKPTAAARFGARAGRKLYVHGHFV